MQKNAAVDQSLAETIVNRIEGLIHDAEAATKPLEVEPFHGQLFELFVMAEAAGCIDRDAENDLSAESICRVLGSRWGLADATRDSLEHHKQLSPQHLSRMRMLWSVMRMWMEWSYAWQRWEEFHREERRDSNGEQPSR
ncbi:MAG: hypothetical protein WD648_14935 [Planctomycetaceae bacterium]